MAEEATEANELKIINSKLKMKILVHGDRPKTHWWEGRRPACECGCRIELEDGDDKLEAVKHSGNVIEIVCPDCCRLITMFHPSLAQGISGGDVAKRIEAKGTT